MTSKRITMGVRRGAATLSCATLMLGLWAGAACAASGNVDTGQDRCFNDHGPAPCSQEGKPFYGQDAQYAGIAPSYRDNGDGTISDLNTGLMWTKAVDDRKLDLDEAQAKAKTLTTGGHNDWRVPNIKELFSLMDFRGRTGNIREAGFSDVPHDAVPYINTDYFDFQYGNTHAGERFIDAQWLSSTKYVSTTMNGMETLFGVNFADGRIKGYGFRRMGSQFTIKRFYARYVRGDSYGDNDFVENGDATVSDRSTGLTWMQNDSAMGMNWEQALGYCEDATLAGHDDWRLPNAKELQYIVDYGRSPDTTDSAAIDPVFHSTSIVNEAGQVDFPFYWTSTTHLDGRFPGERAVYIAFGRAMGEMRGQPMDVHGAGAQRSDPKVGRPSLGNGPQGDAVRVNNYVRCVRGGDVQPLEHPEAETRADAYPNNVAPLRVSGNGTNGLSCGHRPGAGPAGPFGGGRGDGGRRGFVAHLDRDGDGRVSRDEFDGPPYVFDRLDRDGNGYLSDDEAPSHPPPPRVSPW